MFTPRALFRSLSLGVVAALCLSLASCSDSSSPTAPPAAPTVQLNQRTETAHFILRFSEADADKMPLYTAELEGNYDRILQDLGVASLPKISGWFYPDQASYSAAGHPGSGSVQGATTFSVVAAPVRPSLPVHEFVHNATLHLNPTMGSNPVWLWEGVAVYEANELEPPASVPCLASRDYPMLQELAGRQDPCSIYNVGYVLIEFVVERWGIDGVRRLIASNGDIPATLGLTVEAFEGEWYRFLEQRYLGTAG